MNTWLIIGIVVIVCALIFFLMKNKKPKKKVTISDKVENMETNRISEPFQIIAVNLQKLHTDTRQLLENKVNKKCAQVYQIRFNPNTKEILKNVTDKMQEKSIPETELNMDGNKPDEPILKIYQKNPELFKMLGECEFLTTLGTMVTVVSWIPQLEQQGDYKIFDKNMQNLIRRNWKDINTWQKLSDGSIEYDTK